MYYTDYKFTDVSEERDPTLLDDFDPDSKLAIANKLDYL